VLGLFREEFAPVTERSLVDNYRATRTLLNLADRFAATFANRRTSIRSAPGLPDGEQPVLHSASSPGAEARWIAERIAALTKNAGEDTTRISVLTRTHRRSQAVSDAMTAAGVPHVTVEQFEFFRRQEIKDVLARFRLLLNPHDAGSLGRVTRRPASGIGNATLKTLWQEGEPAALRITDLIRPETHTHGEPFAPLLASLRDGAVVVLDVETTGLSPAEDEVVDVGAVRIKNGAIEERFQSLIRPTCPVGFSSEVHGLSDELLREKGREPDSVFDELRDFAGDGHIVGHNVRFDLSMLKAHGERVGVRFAFPSWDDTLEIGRRLVSLERYDLGTLCGHFGTPHLPSHRALADAEATADVLLALRDHLEAGQGRRLELVGKLGEPFARMAGLFESWRKAAEQLRPAELCRLILTESGLGEHYTDDVRRTGHLEDLVQFLAANDHADATPRAALEELVQKVSLARNVDHLDEDDPRVPIITIHQSKGLEFDVVFVAGASEGEIPSFYAVKEGRVEEERRLFYVAITRAKCRLFISCFDRNDFGYSAGPSEFLRAVGNAIAR
jgi:DNA helicase-2/ATP-dependent DNA helicase PcrA